MAGPIATEVVNELLKGLAGDEHPIPVRQVEPVPVKPAPGAPPMRTVPEPGSEGSESGPPLRTTVANLAKPYSAAWWFEKGGTTGIVCLLLVLAFGWMSGSQKDGQKALIDNMQTSEKNRSEEAKQLIQGILKAQVEMGAEFGKVSRALEKLDARRERWAPGVVGPGKKSDVPD